MEQVYVVTHTEATHHVAGLIGGWYDSELTERGRQRADELATYLSSAIPAGSRPRVFSSDLARTRQTAAPIAAALGVEAILDPDLREHSLGVAGGKPQAFLEDIPFISAPGGARTRDIARIEGAEPFAHCVERIYRAVARIFAADDDAPLAHQPEHQSGADSPTVIVTHGGTAGFVIAAWLGIPIAVGERVRFRTPTGSISALVRDNQYRNRTLSQLGFTGF